MSGGLFFSAASPGASGFSTPKAISPDAIDPETLRALAASLESSEDGAIGPEALFAALLARQLPELEEPVRLPGATESGPISTEVGALTKTTDTLATESFSPATKTAADTRFSFGDLEASAPKTPSSDVGRITNPGSATGSVDPARPTIVVDDRATNSDAVDAVTGVDVRDTVTGVDVGDAITEPITETDPVSTERLLPDPEQLHPDLVRRLDRVVQRMEAAGYEVKVVEGYRTPARQQALWAQGRSAPGPVVTWTRHSRHSEGLAVDMMVNGGWTDREGYTALQRIANEEGLRTLGPRDPGHLELRMTEETAPFRVPESRRADSEPRIARASDVAQVARTAPTSAPATPAGIARIAGVARVASVAQVARVATPGGIVRTTRAIAGTVTSQTSGAEVTKASGMAGPVTPATPAPLAAPMAPTAPVMRTAPVVDPPDLPVPTVGEGRGSGNRDTDPTPAPTDAGTRIEALEGTFRPESAASERNPAASRSGLENVPRADAVQTTGASEALGRIDRIRELADRAGPSSVRFDIPGADGEITRVRLGMLRGGLDASLDVQNPDIAREMKARIGELHRALEANSVRAGRLSVNGIAPSLDPAALEALEAATTRDDGVVRDLLGEIVRDTARAETAVTRGESRSDVRDESRDGSNRDERQGGEDRPREETRDEDRRELESWIELLERSRVDQTTEMES